MTDATNNQDNSNAEASAGEQATGVDFESTAKQDAASNAGNSAQADGSSEIEKLRAERDDHYNRYLRAVADLDNYRRRVQREKDERRNDQEEPAASDVAVGADGRTRPCHHQRHHRAERDALGGVGVPVLGHLVRLDQSRDVGLDREVAAAFG